MLEKYYKDAATAYSVDVASINNIPGIPELSSPRLPKGKSIT